MGERGQLCHLSPPLVSSDLQPIDLSITHTDGRLGLSAMESLYIYLAISYIYLSHKRGRLKAETHPAVFSPSRFQIYLGGGGAPDDLASTEINLLKRLEGWRSGVIYDYIMHISGEDSSLEASLLNF